MVDRKNYLGFADNQKHAEKVGTQDGAIVDEQWDVWTAHKSETG